MCAHVCVCVCVYVCDMMSSILPQCIIAHTPTVCSVYVETMCLSVHVFVCNGRNPELAVHCCPYVVSRLHPVIGTNRRTLDKDVVVGDYLLPKGVSLV